MTEPVTPPTAPPVTPPVTPPVVTPPDPELSFTSRQTFNERLERHARAKMKELFGTDDPEQLKAMKAAKDAEEERKKADMTAIERANKERDDAKAAAAAADTELQRERWVNQVSRVCSPLGVKNLDYALFELDRARKADATIDPEKHLKGLMATPAMAAALGIDRDVEITVDPTTTTPRAPGTPPPAPKDPGKQPPEAIDTFKLSKEEFARHLEKIGAQTAS